MGKLKDLIGMTFNKWTVIERAESINGCTRWLCRCECGKEESVRTNSLINNTSKSCGCSKIKDLTGNIYGNWIVLGYNGKAKNGETRWECRCMCEKGTIEIINKRTLIRGIKNSCGCLKSMKNVTHGKSRTKIYKIWDGIKYRCNNENCANYNNYGGRGITICEEWLDKDDGFMNFYNWAMENGYGRNLSIDRIDVNGNYEPENCRWADRKTQGNNKRSNNLLEYSGKIQTVTMWEEELGLPKRILAKRISRGWSVEEALTTRVNEKRRKVN